MKNALVILLMALFSISIASCLPPPGSFDESDVNPLLNNSLFVLQVSSVFASGDDGNVPENVLDDDLSTRWSSQGVNEWITLELNKTYEVQSINISWYNGDVRIAFFDILYSMDGLSWARVYSGESSGTTNSIENYDLQDAGARYVRILGKGNNLSNWNSITTVVIIGKNVDENTVYLDYPVEPVTACGNGIVEEGEQCDNGINNGIECNPPIGSSCTYCSTDCKIITVTDIIDPTPSNVIMVDLAGFANINDGPFNLVHDRRASGGKAVIAPWMYETLGGTYPPSSSLDFSFQQPSGEVSVWVRIYSQRDDNEGWRLQLPGGISRIVRSQNVHQYEWIEAYRGTISGTTGSLRPLGSRSSVDMIIITPDRNPNNFNKLLDLPVPGSVPIARYHVSEKGSDSNSGSQDSPFRTIQKAINLVRPGDTILVREGVYGGFTIDRKSGTANNPITVIAYPGERVILDAYRTSHSGGVIFINNPSNYWIFDGFEITDTHPRLDEVRSLDIREEDDYRRYLELKSELSSKWIYGVRIQSATTRNHSTHLIFRNFEIHDMPRHGFSGNGRYFIYENNHVYNIGYPRSGYAWYSGGYGYVWDGNIVHDAVRAIQARTTRDPYPENMIVQNNLFYRNGRFTWEHSSNSVKGPALVMVFIAEGGIGGNNAVYNNIFLYNGNGHQDQTPNGDIAHNSFIGNGMTSSYPALHLRRDNAVVTNNVFFDNRRNILDEGLGTVLFSNIETSSQVYRNPYKLDFAVVSNSPTINSGANFPKVTVDYYGISRPQGSAWDPGAIER